MRILVPTIGDGTPATVRRLRADGHTVDTLVVGRIERLPCAVPPCDWLVLTSRHAVPTCCLLPTERPHVAVIGSTTAAAARAAGLTVDFQPSRSDSATLLTEFLPWLRSTDRVVRLKPRHAADSLAALAARCRYTALDAYANVPVPITRPVDLNAYDAVYFTCPSSVERLFAVATGRAVCHAIGPATAATLSAPRFAAFNCV